MGHVMRPGTGPAVCAAKDRTALEVILMSHPSIHGSPPVGTNPRQGPRRHANVKLAALPVIVALGEVVLKREAVVVRVVRNL